MVTHLFLSSTTNTGLAHLYARLGDIRRADILTPVSILLPTTGVINDQVTIWRLDLEEPQSNMYYSGKKIPFLESNSCSAYCPVSGGHYRLGKEVNGIKSR